MPISRQQLDVRVREPIESRDTIVVAQRSGQTLPTASSMVSVAMSDQVVRIFSPHCAVSYKVIYASYRTQELALRI